MRIFIAICSLFLFGMKVKAQQRPYYTQYILNNFLVNPAVAGIENYTDIKLSHRMQWVGLQDAPVTTYFTIHTPLSKRLYDVERNNPTTFKPRGRNVMLESYEPADPHHGLGFTVINDRTGPLNRFAAYGSYAYHLNLSNTTNLSFGISAGFSQMSLNTDKLSFDNPIDPAVGNSQILNRIKPDISAGLWLYSRDYFVGIAAQQIIPQQLSFSENGGVQLQSGKLIPHIFAQAGYRFYLNDDLTLLPSVMLRSVSPLPLGVDVNVKMQYLDVMWVGASFRKSDGFAGMLGVNLNHSINIGYSYDITTSKLNTFTKGTHEILLGFIMGNKYDDYKPHNVW